MTKKSKEYIVTDLTRFSKPEKVCTAVVELGTSVCVRPMPYFTTKRCKELNMHPGAILQGNFSPTPNLLAPHSEDCFFDEGLAFTRVGTSQEFKNTLQNTLQESVSKGFGAEFDFGQKHIPHDCPPAHSIITVSIAPASLAITENQYKKGKINLSFTDSDGHRYSYLPITDRGFYDYAMQYYNTGKLKELNSFISGQSELLLRIGLSRRYQVENKKNPKDDRDGYWLQVNGIYTFPDFLPEVRRYI